MLENDIVLARFLEDCGPSLSDDDVASLDALLDLSDNDLWDVIAGRIEPERAHAALVARLRAPQAPPVTSAASPSSDAMDRPSAFIRPVPKDAR
jgi:hypothetical protein